MAHKRHARVGERKEHRTTKTLALMSKRTRRIVAVAGAIAVIALLAVVGLAASGSLSLRSLAGTAISPTQAPVLAKIWGAAGSGAGQFNYPQGIAVDFYENVYVADTGNNRIQKFDSHGNFLHQWGSQGFFNGQFRQPTAIAADPRGVGYVYVLDSLNCRVQQFDQWGNWLATFGSCGTGQTANTTKGQFYQPQGISVGSDNSFDVTDYFDGDSTTGDRINNHAQVE